MQAVVRACHAAGIPFVARGAGTGLSGGALPVADGIVISLARMDRILELDLDSALRLETALFAGLFATDDQKAGMQSFLESGPGKARFTGR